MKFNVNLDVKVSVWQRLDVVIEADSKEQCRALIEKFEGLPENTAIDYENTETLFDTEESLTAKDNGGEPTFEINSIDAA